MPGQRITVLGGSRSGKSEFAERLLALSPPPWTYLATARPADAEMRERVAVHAARRGPDWRTVEAPLDAACALEALPGDAAVLFDCATLWLSNQMEAGHDIAAETDRLVAALGRVRGTVVTVSNEIGAGVVPDNALARQFRDAQGILNQRLAAASDLAVLVVAGLPLVLKGSLPPGMAP